MSSHVTLGSTTWERLRVMCKQLACINKAITRSLAPSGCKLFVPLMIQGREDVLTMVKHLKAGCQSCRQNCKEIQSQEVEVDRFSFRMRYCHTASSWQGELYTSQGRQEPTVAYACSHTISYNMELSSNTAYQSLWMSWKKFCCRNLFSP